MTVTFAPTFQATDIIGWTVEHAGSDDTIGTTFPDHAAAVQALVAHNSACDREDCAIYGGQAVPVQAERMPDVNVSNTNAVAMLDVLGFGNDPSYDIGGECDADNFLGRILLALAVSPKDDGVPAHTPYADNDRWIDCGRRPGYTQDVLDNLRDVAEWSRENGRTVSWA